MKAASVDWRASSSCFKTSPCVASANQPSSGRPTAAAQAASAARSASSSMPRRLSSGSSPGTGRSTPSARLAGERGVPQRDWAGPASPAGVLVRS
eukprot:8007901-Alexandrium_andersonii.AAC.1